MYVLKDKKNIPMMMKGSIVVFIKLDDADFFVKCISEEMRIEKVIFLPPKSIICELKGLIRHE